jgi:mono/diheme cytochrome c family protein
VLGTVPVEADGSAYFRVPSGVPLFFQALDRQGLALQTMRSLTYVQPQQTLACIGCHESREAAPAVNQVLAAVARKPSKLTPGPAGSWPLRFDTLVQPVLDRQCVSCHKPKSGNAKAARLDLMPPHAYDNLLNFGGKDLYRLARERDRSLVGEMPARKSKLLALLTAAQGHEGVRIDPDGLERLATWMDTYAQRQGHYSREQERELAEFRRKLAPLLESDRPAQ